MHILIADDDPISNKLLADSLRRWGHDVIAVRDGQQAWEALQDENSPRMAILDWMMPGLSGVEVCQKLRALNRLYYTYIILLTSKAEKDDIVEGLKAGADDYLTKPFHPRELEVRIGVGTRILSLESELQSALAHLKASERNLTHFVSAMTHDLRTPLVAEQRALELILVGESQTLSERAQGLLKSLTTNNHDLLKLVNQLLEGFHASEAKIALHKEPIPLNTLAEECLSAVGTLTHRKQLTLLNRIPDTLPMVLADAEQLKRVFGNLIGNAIEHIPHGGTIEIASQLKEDAVEVQVKDNGPGIPPAMLPHLFERYHAGAGMSRKIGSGLGLSICKTLVELHGGSIHAESKPGEGTCFCFTLPVETTSPAGASQTAISAFIVDTQELTRLELKVTLEGLEQIQVVGMADGCQTAHPLLLEYQPDIVLVGSDERSHRCRVFHRDGNLMKRLMLVTADSEQELHGALAQNADGYCQKGGKARHLETAMRVILSGLPWLDPSLAKLITQSVPEGCREPGQSNVYNNLTEPERHILQHIASLSQEELAERLMSNTEEIPRHLTSLLRKCANVCHSQHPVR